MPRIDRVAQSAGKGTLVCSITFSVLLPPGHGLVCPILLVVKAGVSTKSGSVCALPAVSVMDWPGAVISDAYHWVRVLGTVRVLFAGASLKPYRPFISIDTAAAAARGVIWFLRRNLNWKTAQDVAGTTHAPPGHPSNASTPA